MTLVAAKEQGVVVVDNMSVSTEDLNLKKKDTPGFLEELSRILENLQEVELRKKTAQNNPLRI